MNLLSKKRMAAQILKVGVSRVKLAPASIDKISDAITKESIRGLIDEGAIWAEPAKGVSRGRYRIKRRKLVKRGRGAGSREGSSGARVGKKIRWVRRVRAMRRYLKMVRDRGDISGDVFDQLYIKVKGGEIGTLRNLRDLVKQLARR